MIKVWQWLLLLAGAVLAGFAAALGLQRTKQARVAGRLAKEGEARRRQDAVQVMEDSINAADAKAERERDVVDGDLVDALERVTRR